MTFRLRLQGMILTWVLALAACAACAEALAERLGDQGFESLAGKEVPREAAPGAWRIPAGPPYANMIEVRGDKAFARTGQGGLLLKVTRAWGRVAAVRQTVPRLPKGVYEFKVWAKGKGLIVLAADRRRRRGDLTDDWARYSLAFEQRQNGPRELTIVATSEAQVDDASLDPLSGARLKAWKKQEEARKRYGFVPDGVSAQLPQPGAPQKPTEGFVDGPVKWREKVVYYDDRYDVSWVSHPEMLAQYLSAHGFRQLGAVAFGEWMKQVTREGAYGTVCVMTHGICPTSVFDDEPSESPIRQYLEAGGRVVWVGGVPLNSVQDEVHPQIFGKAAWTPQLGVRGGWSVGCWKNEGQVEITPLGKKSGLRLTGGATIATYAEDVTGVLSGFYGNDADAELAVDWFKTFNPRYPWSGFIYAARRTADMSDARMQEQAYRLALYAGEPVEAPPGIQPRPEEELPVRVVLDAPRDRRCYYRGEVIPLRLEATSKTPEQDERLAVVLARDGKVFSRGDAPWPTQEEAAEAQVPTADLACGDYALRLSAGGAGQASVVWETTVSLCPRHADPTFFYGMRGVDISHPYRQEMAMRDLAAHAMQFGVATIHSPPRLLDLTVKYGLRFALRAHGSARLTPQEREEALRRGPNGEEVPGAWEGGRGMLGLLHPRVRQLRAEDMAEQVKQLCAWPSCWPRCETNDDFSVKYGFDFSDLARRMFREKTGLEVPIPPQLAERGVNFRAWRPSNFPKGIVPDDDPWLQYSIFCTRDIAGGYNRALTDACVKAVPEIKVGPIPGGMHIPPWQNGQYPPHAFGPGGFNLLQYYYYLHYWQPLIANMYCDEIIRMNNRDMELWTVPDARFHIEPTYCRNTFFLHLAGGCQGLNYYTYGDVSPVGWKEQGRLGNMVVKPLYPFLGKLRPARASAGWLLPYTQFACNNWLYPTNAVYVYANLKGTHLDVEPTCEEEAISGDINRYKAVLLWHVEWLRAAAVKALEDYIARGGVVLADATTTVPIKGAVRLPVDLAMGAGESQPDKEDPRFGRPGIRDYLHPDRVAAIRQALEPYVKPWADCEDPTLITRRHQYGGVSYLWLVNIHNREEYEYIRDRIGAGVRPENPEQAREEACRFLNDLADDEFTARLTIPDGQWAAYDVLKGKRLRLEKAGDRLAFTAEMERLGGTLIALYPEPIAAVKVEAPDGVARGGSMPVKVTVLGRSGRPLPGTQPLKVEVLTPEGTWPEVTGAHATEDGTWTAVLNPAVNDPAGRWRIRVTELSSRTVGEASLAVK